MKHITKIYTNNQNNKNKPFNPIIFIKFLKFDCQQFIIASLDQLCLVTEIRAPIYKWVKSITKYRE